MLFGWSVKASIHSVNCHRWQRWHLLDLGETYTVADARKRCFYNSFQTSFRLVLTCSFTPSSVKAIFTKMTSYLATDSMMAIHFYRLRPTRSLTSLASWDASFMTQTASMWHMFHWSLATDFKFFYKIYKFFEGNLILKKRLFFFISLLRFIFIKCSCLVFSVNIRWKSFISWTWKTIVLQVLSPVSVTDVTSSRLHYSDLPKLVSPGLWHILYLNKTKSSAGDLWAAMCVTPSSTRSSLCIKRQVWKCSLGVEGELNHTDHSVPVFALCGSILAYLMERDRQGVGRICYMRLS